MKLIVGLGNPGEKFANNRHNVGYLFINGLLSTDYRLPPEITVLKTDRFMNDSGSFVKKAVNSRQLSVDRLYIVHDDLDIPLGRFKIHFGKGPLVHYGVNSLEETLGTKDFWRVRIGVDNRDADRRTPGDKYVLEDFTKEELKVLNNLFPVIWEELNAIVKVNSHRGG